MPPDRDPRSALATVAVIQWMSLHDFEKSLSSSLLLSSLSQMEAWLHCHELSARASALSAPSDHALNVRRVTPIHPIRFFKRAAGARQQGRRRRVNALTSAGCASERQVSSEAERAPLRRQAHHHTAKESE